MSDSKPLLSDVAYNRLKWTVAIALPALSTFYLALAGVLSLPYSTQVVGTLAAVAALGGTLLGLSTKSYNNSDVQYDGAVVLSRNDEGVVVHQLNMDATADELAGKKDVKVKVVEV